MTLLCYVAAPIEDAPIVRMVHERLEALGVTPTSRWAEVATSRDHYARYMPAQLRELARRNDADLRGSDVCLVMARAGAGGEAVADARVAVEWGKSVVWVGRTSLSSWRRAVVRVTDVDEALRVLEHMQASHADGMRGELLALTAEKAVLS